MSDSYNEIFDKYYQQNGWSEWIKLYDELIEKNKSKEEQTQEELQVLSAYIIFMRAQLSKKLNENLNSGWKAYCTPSFVLFYKEDWRKLSPNTDIPVLNLYLSPSGIKSLLNKNKTQYNISFNIERVKFDEQNWKKNLKNKLTNALSKEPTMTNKSQIYRFKDTYSIKLNNDKLFVECCNEEVKQIINNVSQQTK